MNFPNQGRDPIDQKRLLMAVAACGAILLLWNWLFPAPTATHPAPGDAGAPVSAAAAESAAAPLSGAPPSAPVVAIERRAAATLAVADRQTAVFTNDDGQLLTWDLEEDQYRVPGEAKGQTLPWQLIRDLARTEAGKGLFLPPRLEVELGGQRARGDYAVVEKNDQRVVFAWTDPTTGVKLTRAWEVAPGGYTAHLTLTAENPGLSPVPYGLQAVAPGAQNNKEAGGSMFSPPVYAFEGVCRRAEDFERKPIRAIISDLEDPDDPTSWSDGITWAGVDNRYFMTAVMPVAGEAESCSFGIGPALAEVPADQVPPDFTLVTTQVRLKGGEIPAGGRVER
ncbi:MAG: YidC/Oxa1 family insertase periplasmic-domain containing protein, partial [bacterium]